MKKIQNNVFCSDNIKPETMGLISSFSADLEPNKKYTALLGFCDVHVHFREPGFSYKGTIFAGSRAAARGGYTAVCTMPNLNPAPDSLESLNVQREIIERDAVIDVYPLGTITKGQAGSVLSDMADMADYVVGFSDDGRGVQNDDIMYLAMTRAKELDKIIVAHCEDNSLLFGGYIHDGEYARAHGHRGICSESEWRQVERDLALVRKTGCKYHVCHISTKETVALIRAAKAEGLDVSCETAPHYLILTDSDLCEDGRFKMNPPLRSAEDREALIEGILDGTIDMIATDHAPHSQEEKSRGLEKSPFGIVGLELAFPALYTHLCRSGILSLARLEELLAISPRKRFGIPISDGDFSLFALDEEFTVNPDDFLSLGRATPFSGETMLGVNYLTVKDGRAVYRKM